MKYSTSENRVKGMHRWLLTYLHYNLEASIHSKRILHWWLMLYDRPEFRQYRNDCNTMAWSELQISFK